jgi:hypothetical protein
MKKSYIMLLLSLFASMAFSQNKQQTSLEEAILKGRIKSVREIAYSAYEKEDKIIKEGIKRSAKNSLTTYNSKGYQTEMVNYKPDGTLDWRYTSSYDDKNLLQEEKTYNSSDSMILHSTYAYENNRIIKGFCYKPNGNLFEYFLYFYDANGNLKEQKGYFDTILFTKWIFNYDSLGRRIYKGVFNSQDSLTWQWHSKFYADGTWGETQTFQIGTTQWNSFDAKGIMQQSRIVYDETGYVIYNDIFEYEYDSKGNWVECRAYRDDVLILITERSYIYY